MTDEKRPHDLDDMSRHLADAVDAVEDMCNGSRRWRMSIPVNFYEDHDVRIGAALNDLRNLIKEARDD